jgi:hypothetical protein
MGSLSPAESEVKTLGTELEETLEEVLEETLGVIEELAFADEEKGVQILHEQSKIPNRGRKAKESVRDLLTLTELRYLAIRG